MSDLPRTSKCLEGLILFDTEELTRVSNSPAELASDLNYWVGNRRKEAGRSETQDKPQYLSPEEGEGARQETFSS